MKLDWEALSAFGTELIVALIAAACASFVLIVVRALARRQVRRRGGVLTFRSSAIAGALIESTSVMVLLAAGLAVGAFFSDLPPRLHDYSARLFFIVLAIQVGFWANAAVRAWAQQRTQASAQDRSELSSVGIVSFVARLVVWVVVGLTLLDNLGVNVTALVAGLGVGGIAAALAVQNVLGDLFASISIALDKPFVVGEFIVIDDVMGVIEFIGVKSTRIRSLGGEQVIVGNADLLGSRLRNYGRLKERRVVFSIGVTYETPRALLNRIASMLGDIVRAQADVRFDRAHLRNFGDSAIEFEIVYYLLNPDYNVYMDVQQAINLAILERFAIEGIQFAYPVTRVLVESVGRASAETTAHSA